MIDSAGKLISSSVFDGRADVRAQLPATVNRLVMLSREDLQQTTFLACQTSIEKLMSVRDLIDVRLYIYTKAFIEHVKASTLLSMGQTKQPKPCIV
jgi:hypothetical protein